MARNPKKRESQPMPITEITPYLFFDGTAEQALRLYERALGAETVSLQRYEDVPDVASTLAPEDAKRVMHASMRLGQASVMVSDVTSNRPTPTGGQVEICLEMDDVDDMIRKFEALAASGKVIAAPHDTFWGAKFGSLVDEFGIHWMFNCTTKAQ